MEQPKLSEEEIRIFESAKCLPEEFAEATDFDAKEAIELDYSITLPGSFSLWKWIYKTNYQGWYWSCTSNWTSHWVQILNVKKWGIIPADKNIITPSRKDLRVKMWHNLDDKSDSWDYVEKAVSTALKEGILIEENWQLAKFDWYATDNWWHDDASIEQMKRYLYNWNPIIWLIRWNAKMWNEMTAGQIKTVPTKTTWAHCIALVGWDETGLWFVNSWTPNDDKKLKSRFHIPYNIVKELWRRFNYRYRVLFMKADANKDPEYLKRKNVYLEILKILKKYYPEESAEVQKWIEAYSASVRKAYPELNEELPK